MRGGAGPAWISGSRARACWPTGVRARDYALGTLISATPSAVSYALLGAALTRSGAFDPVAVAPLVLRLLLSGARVGRPAALRSRA